MTNRYLVFAYDAYYPAGGWCDFKKSFATEQEAIAFADTLKYSGGAEVVDLETEQDIYIYPQHRNSVDE